MLGDVGAARDSYNNEAREEVHDPGVGRQGRLRFAIKLSHKDLGEWTNVCLKFLR